MTEPGPAFAVATSTRACRGGGQDRLAAWEQGGHLVVVVADGAGGTGGGAAAAQSIVDGVRGWLPSSAGADDLLKGLDRRLAASGGQSTAVVLALSTEGIVGASVGDSCALIVYAGAVEDLTGAQLRKPLLGSGDAVPVPFSAGLLGGATLAVASDGLFKYARRDDVVRIVEQADLDAAAAALVALVTLRSGEVPDDVAVVLCRSIG